MSIFYFSCNTRYEIWAHKKIRFTQICIFFVDMKKNSYLRLFKQTVSACFISRQFIQGWLVTVRNACIWIKLYRIFWKYKVESFLNFLTYHSHNEIQIYADTLQSSVNNSSSWKHCKVTLRYWTNDNKIHISCYLFFEFTFHIWNEFFNWNETINPFHRLSMHVLSFSGVSKPRFPVLRFYMTKNINILSLLLYI